MVTYTHDQFELPKLTAARVMILFILAITIGRAATKGKATLLRSPLDLPILLLVIAHIVTTIVSFSPTTSLYGDYENFSGLLTFLGHVALFYILRHWLSKADLARALILALGCASLTACYALAQNYGYDLVIWEATSVIRGRAFSTLGNPNFLAAYLAVLIPLFPYFLLRARPADIWSFSHLLTAGTASSIGILMVRRAYPPGGATPPPALLPFLAGFLPLLAVSLLFWLAFKSIDRSPAPTTSKPIGRIVLSLAMVACLGAMLATGSRGGILALVPSLLLLLIMLVVKAPASNRRSLLIAAVLLLMPLSYVGYQYGGPLARRIQNDLRTFSWQTEKSRMHIWVPALRTIRHHPWLGTGLDTFKISFPIYNDSRFARIDGMFVSSRTAHNEFLQYASTMGLPALGLYLLLLLAAARLQLSLWRSSQWQGSAPLRAALFAGWTAYLLQSLVSFGVVSVLIVFWSFLAISLLAGKEEPGQPSFVLRAAWFPSLLVLPCVLLLALHSLNLLAADSYFQRAQLFHRYAEERERIAAADEISWYYGQEYGLMSQAALLAPLEVKYRVYLGLAAEKSYRFTKDDKWWDLSADSYRRAVQLSPMNSYYYNNLARLHQQYAGAQPASHQLLAEQNFLHAIRLAPATAFFQCTLADFYLETDREAKGLSVIDHALTLNQDFSARQCVRLFTKYLRLGRHELAERLIRIGLRYLPDDADATYYLAFVLLKKGETQSAIELLRKALLLNPQHEPARSLLEKAE